jgi:mannosyltransferase OCH1-like enzyme
MSYFFKGIFRNLKLKIRRFILYLTEYPLRSVPDRKQSIVHKQVIPSILYQTWESNKFGKTHAIEMEKFRDINPELSFQIYTNEDVDNYMSSAWGSHPIYQIYRRAIFGPMKADIFRYCIIYDRGGYYFDVSKGCNCPLISLHEPGDDGLITYETVDCCIYPEAGIASLIDHPEKYVLQWGFGFAKQHPILKQVIDNICLHFKYFDRVEFEIPKNAVLMLTGPGMFTRSFREVLTKYPAISVAQAGINFNGHGVFAMPRSESRYLRVPAYQHARNSLIFRA